MVCPVQRVHICYDDGSRGSPPATAGAGGGRGESKKTSKKVVGGSGGGGGGGGGGSGSGGNAGNAARAAHEELPSAHLDDDALPQERYVGPIMFNRLFIGINWLFIGAEGCVRPRTSMHFDALRCMQSSQLGSYIDVVFTHMKHEIPHTPLRPSHPAPSLTPRSVPHTPHIPRAIHFLFLFLCHTL